MQPLNRQQIDDLRLQIDALDAEIIALVARRHTLAKMIGNYKLYDGLPIIDKIRENELKLLHQKLSIEYNIDPEYILQLYDLIIQQSRSLQGDKNVRE